MQGGPHSRHPRFETDIAFLETDRCLSFRVMSLDAIAKIQIVHRYTRLSCSLNLMHYTLAHKLVWCFTNFHQLLLISSLFAVSVSKKETNPYIFWKCSTKFCLGFDGVNEVWQTLQVKSQNQNAQTHKCKLRHFVTFLGSALSVEYEV